MYDHTVDEVGVIALDFQVESVCRPGHGLYVPLEDTGRHGAQVGTCGQGCAGLLELEQPVQPASLTRSELEVHRGVHVWRDHAVERGRLLRGEPEASPVVPWAPDAQALEETRHASAGFALEGRVVEHRLTLAPARIRPHERPIIGVPDSQSAYVESVENGCLSSALATDPVVVRPQVGERRHGQGVEAEPVARTPDGTREGRQHRMLPAEIVLLLFAVAYAKRRDVRANLAEGTVPEGTAEDHLPLIARQIVVAHRAQHLVTNL